MKSWTDPGFRDYRGERSENIGREAHVRRARAAPPAGVVRVYYTRGKEKTSTSTSTSTSTRGCVLGVYSCTPERRAAGTGAI